MPRLRGGRPVTRWLLVATRIAVGALSSGRRDQAAGHERLRAGCRNYRIVPALLVPYVAAAVVGVEFLAGWPDQRLHGAPGGCGCRRLLVAFIAFVAQALLRGIDLRCGCFGATNRRPGGPSRAMQRCWGAIVMARDPGQRQPLLQDQRGRT